ncbi:uncharacterized protein [Montipora foliosa]|uniref:uncharacterized protein n=1 Tax=Montipora foliosa TaxID=591990 RepID=UPI0035F12C5A
MKPFGCTTFLILMLVLSYVVATVKKADKAISRGEPRTGVSFVNFKEDKFSYLNITILGYSHFNWMPQCSFACLETPTCLSYNLAAYPDINGKLLCELLPSDKYNNSDKFMFNESFHHFSIAEFAGNKDRDTEVHQDLNPLISARYFRFQPTSWHGHISMRVGLFGCPDR